ncbi:hypothetical protein GQ457_06G015970 [Hibiscus cannabinus]
MGKGNYTQIKGMWNTFEIDVHHFSGNVSLGAGVNCKVENEFDPAKDEMAMDEEPTSQIIDVTEKADFGNEKTDIICSCKPHSRIKEINKVQEIDAISGWVAHSVQSNIQFEWENLLNNKGSMFQERLARINGTPLTTRQFCSIGNQYNLSGVLISFDLGGIEITPNFCHDALNSFLSQNYESMFYPKQLISSDADVANNCVSRRNDIGNATLSKFSIALEKDVLSYANRERNSLQKKIHAFLQSLMLERDHFSGGLETTSSTHHNLLEKATHFEVKNEKFHIRVIGLQEELVMRIEEEHLHEMGGDIKKLRLTPAIYGDIFASPSLDLILARIQVVTGLIGCLLIVKNYIGIDGRRDLAGIILVHKVTGVATSLSVTDIAFKAQRASEMGGILRVALFVCTLPGRVIYYRLDPRKMELGLRIHSFSVTPLMELLIAVEMTVPVTPFRGRVHITNVYEPIT